MEKMISIIVPMYQSENTIYKCVASILASTYQKLEVIVVDDGSTDGGATIVKRLAKKDKRVHLIQVPNGGVSKARNIGLCHAQGEYVGFVDSDDYVSKRMYQRLIDEMTDSCDMVTCGCYHCDENGKIIQKKQGKRKESEKQCPKEALDAVIYEQTTMAIWSKLFRREKIVDENGQLLLAFREDQTHYEDFVFICEYLCKCKGTIRFISDRLYYYVQRKGSLSKRQLSVETVRKNMLPLLALEEKEAAKLLYTETFLIRWYLSWFKDRNMKREELRCERRDCKREVKRYRKEYLTSNKVSWWKKLAAICIVKF
jgi:glycosyltransferase involved in cell wall biosynthesis